MPAKIHDFETTTYNQPGLALDTISGLTVPGNPNPIFVPMKITSFSAPNAKSKFSSATFIPLIDEDSNLSYGGQTVLDAATELPKIIMEGTIDSPMVASGNMLLPNITTSSGTRMTYAEVVTMQWEGRAGNTFKRVRPRWFRDPYGRVYGDMNNDSSVTRPRIMDFRANYMEQYPQRTQFSLTLMV